MRTNGTSRLGSGVLPLDAGSTPPTNERGTVSSLIQGYLPQWQTLDAQDELETNLKLTFPESITSYHNMRTDPQVQGLLTGAVWPLLRMRWYIDPNGAPDEQVEHISADYNLPIEDPNAPMMAAVPQQLMEFDQENTDRPANPVSAAAPVPRQQKPTPPQPILMQEPPPVFHQRRTQVRFNFLEHLETALDAIAYGFMAFEQVGYIGSDGFWHLRKLGLRPPQTITEISLAKDGGIDFIRQGNILEAPIPINRLVMYSFQKRGANWHGRSMLRGCYAPWLLKDRAMRVGVMNIQRAGVGTPIAVGHPGASESDLRVLSEMTQRLVAGDRSGGAIPYGSTLKLVGVEGGQPDTVGFIKLMNEEMARSFFQMFMQLGQTTSGSRALGTTFVEYHKLVTEYIAQWFAMIFNEHVIEDDIDWNYGPEEEFAPILRWKWDEEGSDRNPDGPTAAGNPAQAFQKMAHNGELNADDKTKAMLFNGS